MEKEAIITTVNEVRSEAATFPKNALQMNVKKGKNEKGKKKKEKKKEAITLQTQNAGQIKPVRLTHLLGSINSSVRKLR